MLKINQSLLITIIGGLLFNIVTVLIQTGYIFKPQNLHFGIYSLEPLLPFFIISVLTGIILSTVQKNNKQLFLYSILFSIISLITIAIYCINTMLLVAHNSYSHMTDSYIRIQSADIILNILSNVILFSVTSYMFAFLYMRCNNFIKNKKKVNNQKIYNLYD